MMFRLVLFALTLAIAPTFAQSNGIQDQVRETEKAFAKTMADRDFAAFQSFIASDAVFFGSSSVMHGAKEVASRWKQFFDGAKAPFSWEPNGVEVLESGSLAMTYGPVWDPDHKRIGTFSSIWRKDAAGKWKIVFDKGWQCE